MSDYFGFPNMANVPNPSEWKHSDTAKDWAEKANDSATLAKNYAEQVVENVSVVNEHVQRMDEHITEVTTDVLASAQTAITKASEAATSATNASASATLAGNKADAATASATAAAASASAANAYKNTAQSAATQAVAESAEAQDYATAASVYANNASTSATAASTSATAAAQSSTEASTYASEVESLVSAAEGYKDDAEEAATAATADKLIADAKATAATASANAAAASVTQAQQVVSTASAYAAQAQTQATNAATSATSASTSATSAATSATNASESADDAAESATAAAASAETASGAVASVTASATAAATSATSASNSATTANTFMTSAATSASEAAASAAAAASSAATCDTDEFTPTGEYNNNGPGRNRKLIDKLDITDVPGTPASEAYYNLDDYKIGFQDTDINLSGYIKDVLDIPYMNISWSSLGTVKFNAYNNAQSSITVDYDGFCLCISKSISLTRVCTVTNSVETDLSASEYTVLTNDARQFIIVEGSHIANSVKYEFDIGSYDFSKFPYSIGRLYKRVDKAIAPTVKLFSANSALDKFNVRVKRDHRVRVHINLPFRDHMNDNDGFNHDVCGFGFSGGNFCPDSDLQYSSVKRYAGVGTNPISLGNAGVSMLCGRDSSFWSNYKPGYINTSSTCANPYNTYGNDMFGRIHTGWCSWVLPGFINMKDESYTASCQQTKNYASLCRAFSKLFVPIASDLNEDSTPLLSYINDTLMYGDSSCCNQGFRLNALNFIECSTTKNNTYTDKYKESLINYTLPRNINANGTSIVNPRMSVYAGLQLRYHTNMTNTPTVGAYTLKDATYGISRGDDIQFRMTLLDAANDRASLTGPNKWHENPILGDYCSAENYGYATTPFINRCLMYSTSSSPNTENKSKFGGHNTLGIRYFDAEAQEWRVFSPGDNCSYGYDGTHWNYREYLWVDLDKPVTYIVGGIASNGGFNSSGEYNTDWSTFSAANATLKAKGVVNPYQINSYGPANNAGFRYYAPSDTWASGTKVNDLIHVETPNFDNYTSYTKWRGITMMTVDYSSSPLGPDNTVYCADSAYGCEETGVLDLSKISCMYGLQAKLNTYNVSGAETNFYKDSGTVQNLGTNTKVSLYSKDARMLQDGHLVGTDHDATASEAYDIFSKSLEHTCYHIRIGLES